MLRLDISLSFSLGLSLSLSSATRTVAMRNCVTAVVEGIFGINNAKFWALLTWIGKLSTLPCAVLAQALLAEAGLTPPLPYSGARMRARLRDAQGWCAPDRQRVRKSRESRSRTLWVPCTANFDKTISAFPRGHTNERTDAHQPPPRFYSSGAVVHCARLACNCTHIVLCVCMVARLLECCCAIITALPPQWDASLTTTVQTPETRSRPQCHRHKQILHVHSLYNVSRIHFRCVEIFLCQLVTICLVYGPNRDHSSFNQDLWNRNFHLGTCTMITECFW